MLRALLPRLLLACFVAGIARAEWPRLPPIEGELSGKFASPALPECPPVEWRITLKPTDATHRQAELTLTAPGLKLSATAQVENATGDGSWKIESADIEVARWWKLLAPQLGPMADGLSAEGTIQLKGGGAMRAGQPTGELICVLTNGKLQHTAQGWTLEGVTLSATTTLDPAEPHLIRPLALTFDVATITTTRFGARSFHLAGTLNDRLELAVTAAKVEVAGGDVKLDPFTATLSPLNVEATAHINRVGLQDIAALVPAGLADARGRIDGTVRLGWSTERGLLIGAGQLSLQNDETAFVRLAESPGFLTKRVPERFTWLPDMFGSVAQKLAPANPAFPELRDIELGRTELRVESLQVKLTPERDEQGHTAHIELAGRPIRENGVVGPVKISVNVDGPLADVIRMGLNQPVSVQVR